MNDREKLVLVQSSMQFSDSPRQIERDARALMQQAVELDWDVIALSETPKRGRVFPFVRRAVAQAGWQLQHEIRGDCRFILNPKHELVESGYVHLHDARSGHAKGNYSARGVAELTFRTPAGNVITDHSTHWLTGYVLDRRPGAESERERKHDAQTEAVIERVLLHSRGKRLSFWQGDTNVDEDRDRGWDDQAIHRQFTRAGLLSIFDELDEYPSTHGRRTIDVVGHTDRDGRVRAESVRVLPRDGRHSDHLIVEASYSIAPKRRS